MLTIAVPTFNRLADLQVCLKSIFSAANGMESSQIELIVSSNASDDGTDEFIASLDTSHIQFRYHRWDTNAGPIRNFLKLVELAKGDWLWFVSDDDAVTQDALRLLLKVIEGDPSPEGITLSSIPCDCDLHPLTEAVPDPVTKENVTRRDEAPFSHSQLREYLHDWGLLSVCVFPVKRWREILPQLPIPQDDCYPHVWIQSKMLAESTSWCRILQPTVLWRNDRDSFLAAHGALKRALMPITTYGRLAEFHKSKNPSISHACRDLSCSFLFHYTMQFKKGWVDDKDVKAKTYVSMLQAAWALKAWKHHRFFTKSIPALLIPKYLVLFIKNNIRKIH